MLNGSGRALACFAALGSRLRQRWSKYHCDVAIFPEIAAAGLNDSRLWQKVSGDDIITWLASCGTIPRQPNLGSNFGQPPVTVFWDPAFYIEVLYWTTGTTTIHQHGFSGAFAVLEGSSIACQYTFHDVVRVNTHLSTGRLALKAAQMLAVSHVEPIKSGHDLIHSVFHLDYPSVTVVVRTETDIEAMPQYDYQPPGVAINSSYMEPLTKRRLQVLELVARTKPERYDDVLATMLRHSDVVSTYYLLRAGCIWAGDSAGFREACNVASACHGDIVDSFRLAALEAARQTVLIRLRNEIQNSDERLLVALLLNVPSVQAALAVLANRASGTTSADFFVSLFGRIVAGRPRLLGCPWDDLSSRILRAVCEDPAPASVILGTGKTCDSSLAPDARERYLRLRQSPLLSRLLEMDMKLESA